MKTIALALLFISSISIAAEKFETTCKDIDCFKYGWVTVGEGDYTLNTTCKNQDCVKNGWTSIANDKSTYDVTCRADNCFQNGWTSEQVIDGNTYHDKVTCLPGGCLTEGWQVKTGYDIFGGNVTCNFGDCNRFGGKSFWRGRNAETSCYLHECYTYGWTLTVY